MTSEIEQAMTMIKKDDGKKEMSKYSCPIHGHTLLQMCEYPKCPSGGKKRTYILRLCDFHESRFPFLCDKHYEECKKDMRTRMIPKNFKEY